MAGLKPRPPEIQLLPAAHLPAYIAKAATDARRARPYIRPAACHLPAVRYALVPRGFRHTTGGACELYGGCGVSADLDAERVAVAQDTG